MRWFYVDGRNEEIDEVEVELVTEQHVFVVGSVRLPKRSIYGEFFETRADALAAIRRRLEAHINDADERAAEARRRLSAVD